MNKLSIIFITLLLCFLFMSAAGAADMEGRVTLHFSHVGADSTNFSTEEDCGGVNAGVVWHLVLNQLDPGTEPQSLHATFQEAGHLEAVGKSVGNGKVQHFYIGTPDDDVLSQAYVMIPDQSRTPKLLLSHVCRKDQKVKDDNDIEDNDKDKIDEPDKKEKEREIPGEEPKVDPDKETDKPKDSPDKIEELPQTAGKTYFPLMGFSILLTAFGLMVKLKNT